MAIGASKTARLETRITPEQKLLIERAAAYQGRSLSDFVVDTLQEAARAVIEREEILRLTESQSRDLVAALLSPPEPNAELRRAAEDYHRNTASR